MPVLGVHVPDELHAEEPAARAAPLGDPEELTFDAPMSGCVRGGSDGDGLSSLGRARVHQRHNAAYT